MQRGNSTLLQQVRDRSLDLQQQAKQARSPDSICAKKVMSKEIAEGWGVQKLHHWCLSRA
jgi:hypothetical protein